MSVKAHTFTIANGQTDSNIVDLDNRSLIGFRFPTMTGTSLTIKESDGTPVTLGDESAAITISNPSGRSVRFYPLFGMRRVQLVSGGAEAAERTIQVLTDDYTA